MKQKIRGYFRTFGNPDYADESYWEQDPNLFQVLFGLLVFPLFAIGWIAYKFLSIEISL